MNFGNTKKKCNNKLKISDYIFEYLSSSSKYPEIKDDKRNYIKNVIRM